MEVREPPVLTKCWIWVEIWSVISSLPGQWFQQKMPLLTRRTQTQFERTEDREMDRTATLFKRC